MDSKRTSMKSEDESTNNIRQRRGTYRPRDSSLLEDLNRTMKTSSVDLDKSTDVFLNEVRPWLEKVNRKGPFSVKDGKVLYRVAFPDNFYGIYCAKYSPDGSVIATSYGSGAIQIRKAEDGSLLHTVRAPVNPGIPVMSLRFHPQNQNLFFAASACGHIFTCTNEEEQHKTFVFEQNNEVNTIDINCTGKVLVSGGKNAVLRVYDVNNAKLLCTYPSADTQQTKFGPKAQTPYHKSRIFAVRFHPERENIFVSGGWDDVVKVWDLRMNSNTACTATIRGPHICGESIDVKNNTVLTGSWTASNSIQLWDLNSAKIIETITPHNRPQTLDGEFLYCAQFFYGDHSGNTILTGGSGTALIEVISVLEKKIICYFKLNKTVQTIDSHYERVVYGGMENYFKVGEYLG